MKKKKIAFFTTGWCGEILSQFLKGIQNSLENEHVDIFLFLCYPTYIDSNAIKKGELNIFSLPDIKEFDGVFIFGSGLNFQNVINDLIDRSTNAGVPVIIQGDRQEGAYYLGSDNYVATIDMCEHLHKEHNVKDVIFLAGTKESMDSELRLQAVKDYFVGKGISDELTEVFYTNWENAAVTKYINQFCDEGRTLPDVFICANDGLAMEACISLNNRGIKVPEDVLITGYDFIDDSQIFAPSIASVDQCFTQMGTAAGQLWLKLIKKPGDQVSDIKHSEISQDTIIPCKFIPGESCKCYIYRDSDKIRRRVGREAFSKRAMTTYFNRKLNLIDATVLSCLTFKQFKDSLNRLLTDDHNYEGDSFHILLEPNFGLSIYDSNIILRTSGYSKYMEVVYSSEEGKRYEENYFPSDELIPNYSEDGKNHLYAFLPLHEADEAYGYIIFRDCIEKIENHFLQTYQSRMGLVFDKFRHALSLDMINKRLVEIMRRDPLTNVNNRRAYEDKEKYLQSVINANENFSFAIAMFDINNLKLINDSKGHDAGDDYIVRACHLICDVFKHSPVYRVGGDEFVAILTGEDYDNYNVLLGILENSMSPYSNQLPLPNDYISIACGVSAYNPREDRSIQDVVKRADEIMYENKAKMKAQNS